MDVRTPPALMRLFRKGHGHRQGHGIAGAIEVQPLADGRSMDLKQQKWRVWNMPL